MKNERNKNGSCDRKMGRTRSHQRALFLRMCLDMDMDTIYSQYKIES